MHNLNENCLNLTAHEHVTRSEDKRRQERALGVVVRFAAGSLATGVSLPILVKKKSSRPFCVKA